MTASKPEDVYIKLDEKDPDEKEEHNKEKENGTCCTYRALINTVMLVVWILTLEGIGFALGRAFPTDEWYFSKNKSPGTPPGPAFGIAWSILYLTLGIFGWFLSLGLKERQIIYMFVLFWLQQILNFLWVPVFQKLHQPVAGLVILCIMIVLNAILIVRLWMLKLEILGVKTRYIALIIVPYWLWLCYASHLNAYIVIMN